jgi:hypothetical protein
MVLNMSSDVQTVGGRLLVKGLIRRRASGRQPSKGYPKQASPRVRPSLMARFTAEANLLITPNPHATSITFDAVGPNLLGAAKPIHVLKPTSTMRSVVKMTASRRVAAA